MIFTLKSLLKSHSSREGLSLDLCSEGSVSATPVFFELEMRRLILLTSGSRTLLLSVFLRISMALLERRILFLIISVFFIYRPLKPSSSRLMVYLF